MYVANGDRSIPKSSLRCSAQARLGGSKIFASSLWLATAKPVAARQDEGHAREIERTLEADAQRRFFAHSVRRARGSLRGDHRGGRSDCRRKVSLARGRQVRPPGLQSPGDFYRRWRGPAGPLFTF